MQHQDAVTLTIDGREVSVPQGASVLHAAEQLGIEIPTFCYSKKMDPLGACRMCLVSIEKAKGFPPACATPVSPGMVVHTITPDVVKTQQGMLEFLLINHPLDCPICDKGGECPLQNQTFKYGPGKSRYTEEKRHFVKHLPIGPRIVLDRERCIVCQLCVRFMEDVADDPQIVLMSRGGKTEVNVFPDRPFDSPFAGNTIELCPVGALTSRTYRFKARPWDLEHAPGVCPTCSVGCNVTLDTRRNELLRLVNRENLEVDDGWLCDYGRFGTLDRLREGERVRTPLIRRNGTLQEASWDEALVVAAAGLSSASRTSVAALAGAQSTNEELYVLGRLFRSLLRSPDVAVPTASAAPSAMLGGGLIGDLERADAILLFDADPLARQHVLDLRIKKQVKRRGVPLLIISNEKTGLDYLASAKAGFDAGNPLATLTRLIGLLGHGSARRAEVSPSDTNGLVTSVASALTTAKDTVVAAALDVADMVRETVSAKAQPAPDDLDRVAAALADATRGVVLFDERILAAGNVAELTGLLATLAARLSESSTDMRGPLALAAAANSRGAAEMGADGAWLAGGAELGDADTVAKLRKAWGLQPVATVGKNALGILTAARDRSLQGLLLFNHDPAEDGGADALAALEGPSFVVLHTSRKTPAMSVADVVLPSATFAETEGTLTNTEGRVQRIHRALESPGEARQGWQVLQDIAAALETDFGYRSSEDIVQEIARVTGLQSWAGLARQALEPVAAGSGR